MTFRYADDPQWIEFRKRVKNRWPGASLGAGVNGDGTVYVYVSCIRGAARVNAASLPVAIEATRAALVEIWESGA